MMDAATVPETFRAFSLQKENAIQKVNYSHDAMIDQIVANPWVSQGQLARYFGYTEGWVSQIIASDSFQSRLAERKNELVDPTIRATIEERFKGLVIQSLEVLRRKLESPIVSDELALKALDVAAKAAGYGAKAPLVNQNMQFVVQVPSKAGSSEEWSKTYSSGLRALPARELEPLLPAIVRAPAEEADALLEELSGAVQK